MHRSDDSLLRYVDLGNGYTLQTWDAYRSDNLGKSVISYRLARHATTIFEGVDFACSPLYALDSDETLRALLTFLTLRPGDTDAQYFDSYTPEQLHFRDTDAEALSILAHDASEFVPAIDDFHLHGTIISGTLQPRYLIPVFVCVLRICSEINYDGRAQAAAHYAQLTTAAGQPTDLQRALTGDMPEYWEMDAAAAALDELFDILSEVAPDGYYFGAHPGDGSDFGFWPFP